MRWLAGQGTCYQACLSDFYPATHMAEWTNFYKMSSDYTYVYMHVYIQNECNLKILLWKASEMIQQVKVPSLFTWVSMSRSHIVGGGRLALSSDLHVGAEEHTHKCTQEVGGVVWGCNSIVSVCLTFMRPWISFLALLKVWWRRKFSYPQLSRGFKTSLIYMRLCLKKLNKTTI